MTEQKETLTKLVNARSKIIADLDRFTVAFEKLSATTPPDTTQIELRLSKAESLLDDFNNIQTEIEDNDSVLTLKEHGIERSRFEDSYFDIISRARRFLSNQLQKLDPISDTKLSDAVSAIMGSNTNIKLPPIPLPTFDGNYEQWLFYKDTFISLIHSNESIPAVQKFHYLRLSLKGQAADLLKSLECSAANYAVAWSLVVQRYENTEMLIRNHIKAIFDIETITKESHSGLRGLVDGITRHIRALEALDQPVDSWDVLLIHIVSTKLDRVSRREWETEYNKLISSKEKVTMETFSNFLLEKCKLLETLGLNNENKVDNKSRLVKVHSSVNESRGPVCSYCNKNHTVYNCKEFLALDVEKRIIEAKRLKFCLNCLRKNHATEKCKSSSCRKCEGHHNSLLHADAIAKTKSNSVATENKQITGNIPNNTASVNNNPDKESQETITNTCNTVSFNSVLLSTALVHVFDNKGNSHQCRVLLDSGSQSEFISASLCKTLGLPLSKIDLSISCVGQNKAKVLHRARVKLQARHSAFQLDLNCLVLPKITSNLPVSSVDMDHINIPPNLFLADPTFNESGPIDILIGARHFWGLLDIGQIKLGSDRPTLQKTHLGWIISGSISPSKYIESRSIISCNFAQSNTLDIQLRKFWEIDENHSEKLLSPEEQACEKSFEVNTVRDSSGRFLVTLPLKYPPTILGDSLELATKRFLLLERKLHKNPDLFAEYSRFLEEYESLNHMTKIDFDSINPNKSYFLPHHAVMKESSTTTKLRVVFDGSAKTTSGHSLNDILMVGPNVQEDLLSILIRFRKHSIVLTGDIEKMYRQVLVQEDQRNLQIILWRSNPSSKIQYFRLNTLTYGTASASYLSTRCIKELANIYADSNPKVSATIYKDFYVDDLVTGGQTVEEVQQIKSEITDILNSGGFHLRKFLSNNSQIISDNRHTGDMTHQFKHSQEAKTLGLLWDSDQDILRYSITASDKHSVSKRTILSYISQIFDPLGLLAPTVIIAKIIIQKLWVCKLDWDESIPADLYTTWKRFQSDLHSLNNLKIPRHILCNFPTKIEIHSFSDASESAYGACIYARSIDSCENVRVQLLCAKTRVAPLKTITIPKLEFCAALLSAELTQKVKTALNTKIDACHHWSDSTITLAWIRSSPHLWKIFVSNRVAQIQSLTDVHSWCYVNTNENPADLLSRGLLPSDLLHNDLWWYGPSWLSKPKECWPVNPESTENLPDENLPESRSKLISLASTIPSYDFDLIEKSSNLNKLIRTTAYCLRFFRNLKLSKVGETLCSGILTVEELNVALYTLVKLVQSQTFAQEISDLSVSNEVNSKSKLLKLNPFIDSEGILRVGGRIKHSNFSYEKKFPAILPIRGKLSLLIVQREHIRLLHAGPQNLLASIRDRFWILSGRNLVRKVVRNCTRCFRFDATAVKYRMGDLPAARVTPARPFMNSGVDFCGPFNIKDRMTRNYKLIKAYICVFVCLSTRAMHLELVTDLSTASFLAALRRLFSRRGICANIYSDNGSTFVGANNEIKKFLRSSESEIQSELSSNNVKWHFIPPRAPNFGGLWEAGVKSTKSHLKRVLSNTILNYEEFITVLSQIEACLNSRPLSPLSPDPNDPEPLTPGHFLIGTKLTTLPEQDMTDVPSNRLSRYQLTQKLVQHFWKRWSKEVISEMQQRIKWHKNFGQSLRPGVVVMVKEDNLPPLQWKLAVVDSVHPGSDGIVRAATLRTSSSIIKRPANKLCILPINEQDGSDIAA
ncbi:uncharacterized protein LOC112904129 [Agrilus planipennis]|uniref:Uncharacterized protein LOC112904129 n=1 Tax=Agrilus planipennis TaxID=224129 RepID=A0A7F5R2G3_AGRPL|nr:uncharacterized protein LOC112904129 [Agrilus planipennis]